MEKKHIDKWCSKTKESRLSFQPKAAPHPQYSRNNKTVAEMDRGPQTLSPLGSLLHSCGISFTLQSQLQASLVLSAYIGRNPYNRVDCGLVCITVALASFNPGHILLCLGWQFTFHVIITNTAIK